MTNEKSCCPTKASSQCCPKKWVMASIAAFALTFVFEWLVHGKLLMEQYTATASLWRTPEAIEAMMPLGIAKHALMAFIFTALLMQWKRTQTFGALFTSLCPVRKGFFFGAGIGLLLGINAASAYIYMPLPQNLALAWLAAEIAKWGIAGGVLTLLFVRCSKA